MEEDIQNCSQTVMFRYHSFSNTQSEVKMMYILYILDQTKLSDSPTQGQAT